MIAVDASAVLAILLKEEDANLYSSRLAAAGAGLISAVNYWEAMVRAEAEHGRAGLAMVDDLLAALHVDVVDADATTTRLAVDAFRRFKGRPSRLNLGDSFAYALAQREGDGLLYKGQDFPLTDIKSAFD